MSVKGPFNPPIDIRTGQVSARLLGVAILRPLPGGGYIAFDSVNDAINHPTTPRKWGAA